VFLSCTSCVFAYLIGCQGLAWMVRCLRTCCQLISRRG
jgi:hypothetical protein